MVWWIYLIIVAASQVASFLLRPKIEDTKPETELDLPQIDRSRLIPVVFGEWIIKDAQNIWWGDLWAAPIKKKQFNGLWFSTIILGHRYYVGMVFVAGHAYTGTDEPMHLVDIYITGKLPKRDTVAGPWSENEVPVIIRDPMMFGELQKEGGVLARTWFYNGRQDPGTDPNTPNAYWQGRIVAEFGAGETLPDYRDLALFVWEGPRADIIFPGFGKGFFNLPAASGYIGNSARLWDFWLKVYLTPLWGTGTIGTIGDGPMTTGRQANPILVVYTILRSPHYGLNWPEDLLDFGKFEDVATALWNEGMAFAYYWTQGSAEEMIAEIMRMIDGVLVEDPDTGKIYPVIARKDYEVEDLPVLNKSNFIEIRSAVRKSVADSITEVKITYTDHETDEFLEDSAISQDIAMFEAKEGQPEVASITYRGCPYAAQAAILAERELNALVLPLFALTAIADRSLWAFKPGDLFVFHEPELKAEQVVMRVGEVTDGSVDDLAIELQATEDVYGIADAIYTAPGNGLWTETRVDPEPADFVLALESPYWFSPTDNARAIACCALPSRPHISWDMLMSDELQEAGIAFALTAVLTGAYPQFTNQIDSSVGVLIGSVIEPESLAEVSAEQIQGDAANLALLIDEADPDNHEWIAFQSFVDNGGGSYTLGDVWRGLLDTPPIAHAAGVRLWLVDAGFAVSADALTGAADVLHLPSTTKGRLDAADATPVTVTPEARALAPYPVAGLRVNFAWGSQVILSGDLRFDWYERNRIAQAMILSHLWGTEVPEPGTDYRIDIYGTDGVTLLHSEVIDHTITIPPITWTYDAAAQTADGADLETRLVIKAWSVRNGVDAFRPFTLEIFKVAGSFGNAEWLLPAISFDFAQVSQSVTGWDQVAIESFTY